MVLLSFRLFLALTHTLVVNILDQVVCCTCLVGILSYLGVLEALLVQEYVQCTANFVLQEVGAYLLAAFHDVLRRLNNLLNVFILQLLIQLVCRNLL